MALTAVAGEEKATASKGEQCCLKIETASLLTASKIIACHVNVLMPNPVNLLMLTNR